MDGVKLYSHLNLNYFNYRRTVVLTGANRGLISEWVNYAGEPKHKEVEVKVKNNPFFFFDTFLR